MVNSGKETCGADIDKNRAVELGEDFRKALPRPKMQKDTLRAKLRENIPERDHSIFTCPKPWWTERTWRAGRPWKQVR